MHRQSSRKKSVFENGLTSPSNPAVKIHKAASDPTTWKVVSTDIGHQVLRGDLDWLQIATVDRWIGGVHIQSGHTVWRIGEDLKPVWL